MYRRMLAAAAATILFNVTTVPALACGHGECYEKVRLPDEYRTVSRAEVVRPGWREVVHTPPVVQRHVERVAVAPGRIVREHMPAVHATVMRHEMVAPARVHRSFEPAVVRTVHETVVVRPGGHRWEHRVDAFGRERRCRVPVAPVTRTVARQVVVAPARTIEHIEPAVYRAVPRTVLVAPARTRSFYQPPAYDYVARDVVVRPAARHVVEHPPVVRHRAERVFVRHGGYGWRRTHW